MKTIPKTILGAAVLGLAGLAPLSAQAALINGGAGFGIGIASFTSSGGHINTATSITLTGSGSSSSGVITNPGTGDLSNLIAFSTPTAMDPNGAASGLVFTIPMSGAVVNFGDFFSALNWEFDAFKTTSIIGNAVSATQWTLNIGLQGVLHDTTNALETTPADVTLSFTETNTGGADSLSGTGTISSPASCTINDSCVTVPEPASLSLLGFGLLGIGALRRRVAS